MVEFPIFAHLRTEPIKPNKKSINSNKNKNNPTNIIKQLKQDEILQMLKTTNNAWVKQKKTSEQK